MSVWKNTQETPFSELNVSSYLRSIAFFMLPSMVMDGRWGKKIFFLYKTPLDKNVNPNFPNKTCDQRLNNSVILISLSQQQVRYGPYCPSPPSTSPPQTSFSTFSSFLCLNTSFHPLEPAVFLFLYQGLTFFFSLSLPVQTLPSLSFLFFPLPSLVISLPASFFFFFF